MPDLGPAQWAITIAVCMAGGVATGGGGFGFALVTTPVLLWVLPPPLIVLTNLAMSVALRVPLTWSERRHVVGRQAALLGVGGLIGLPIGVVLLTRLDGRVLTTAAHAVIILLSTTYLVGAERLPRLPDPGGLGRVLVGIGSGALNTSVSVSGPPLVLWLLNQQLSGRPFRATMSVLGLGLNLIGVVLLIRTGAAELSWLVVTAAALPAAALGTVLGHVVLGRLSQAVFVRAAALFVVVTSATGLLVAL